MATRIVSRVSPPPVGCVGVKEEPFGSPSGHLLSSSTHHLWCLEREAVVLSKFPVALAVDAVDDWVVVSAGHVSAEEGLLGIASVLVELLVEELKHGRVWLSVRALLPGRPEENERERVGLHRLPVRVGLLVMDVVDLVSAMEEKFGVTAAAAVAAAPAVAGGDAGAGVANTGGWLSKCQCQGPHRQ